MMSPRQMQFANISIYAVFIAAAAIFAALAILASRGWINSVWPDVQWEGIALAAVAYFVSHVMRAARLYVILLEFERSIALVVTLYATLTLFNLVVPFKLGEAFRLFEFTHMFRSVRLAVVVIVTERFFDAVTLLWLLLYGFVLDPAIVGQTTMLIVVLSTVVIFGLLIYRGLPGFARYLRFLVTTRSRGRRGLDAMRVAGWLEGLWQDLSRLLRGRAVVLAVISFAVWAFEILALGLIVSSTMPGPYTGLAGSLLGALNSLLTVGSAPLDDAVATYFVLTFVVVLVIGGPLTIVYTMSRARAFHAAVRGARGARAPYIRKRTNDSWPAA